MTHEEVVASLAAGEISSYRQLPRLVFQIQIKWRDDPRPRAGMIRAREFTMKDSYSLDLDEAGLDTQYGLTTTPTSRSSPDAACQSSPSGPTSASWVAAEHTNSCT